MSAQGYYNNQGGYPQQQPQYPPQSYGGGYQQGPPMNYGYQQPPPMAQQQAPVRRQKDRGCLGACRGVPLLDRAPSYIG
ncbi:MAG: hypothetical protein M1826_006314 [Phylliscum demangeonii]|nr:MAG: hypothetical protein M1826_006314 [Phylliscum demangeonii]